MEIEYTTTFRRSRLDLLDGFFESWPARPTPVVLLRLLQSSDIALPGTWSVTWSVTWS